jgi:hypothetical protein
MSICPYCGASVTKQAGRRGAARRFCVGHQQKFNDLAGTRGKSLVSFVVVWQALRKSRDPDLKRLRAYAFGQMNALGALWASEDRAAGRSAVLVVRQKMAAGWMAADLKD